MLDMIRLGMASDIVFKQVMLHGQLAQLEWAEEKLRLFKMLFAILLGFAFLVSALCVFSVLIVALSWETPYRLVVLISMIVLYGFGIGAAWNYCQNLLAQGMQAFSASRKEFFLDTELLKSAL